MCIKILHCVVDEKFIDGAIELFDSIEGIKQRNTSTHVLEPDLNLPLTTITENVPHRFL